MKDDAGRTTHLIANMMVHLDAMVNRFEGWDANSPRLNLIENLWPRENAN
jgi:hypothetical protein